MLSFEKSKQYYEQACEFLATGVSSSMRKGVDPILYFDRAEGPYYYDVDGNTFIDYTLAWGPLIVGSNHPAINKAVTEQIQKSYTLGAQHKLEIDLASKMVSVLPGVDQVIFSNTGSESVQAAFRIARAKTGRKKVVKFEGHYHGWFNNILVSYRPQENQAGTTTPTCGGQPESEYEDTLTLRWNDIDALKEAFKKYPDQIACVITEPILANSGSCMPKDGFLEAIIDVCKENGAISIFDEVITGFRIALGGAREYFGINPDLSVYAKAMAGGFTMGAVGGKREIFDVLREGKTIHAGTYNGSSFNLAAAVATIDILSAEGTYNRMHEHGYAIRKHVEALAKEYNVDLVTTGVGSVFSLHFGQSTAPEHFFETTKSDMETFAKFRKHLLQEGVQTLPDGRWYVGATHTDKELEKTESALSSSFENTFG